MRWSLLFRHAAAGSRSMMTRSISHIPYLGANNQTHAPAQGAPSARACPHQAGAVTACCAGAGGGTGGSEGGDETGGCASRPRMDVTSAVSVT